MTASGFYVVMGPATSLAIHPVFGVLAVDVAAVFAMLLGVATMFALGDFAVLVFLGFLLDVRITPGLHDAAAALGVVLSALHGAISFKPE